MDLEGLKKEMSKSNRKSVIIGSFIFAFGVFFIWLVLSGADSEMKTTIGWMIGYWTLIAVFIFTGGLLIVKPQLDKMKMKTGDHPLINAIENNDKGYVVWVYEHVVSNNAAKSHSIHIYPREGKLIAIQAKHAKVQEIMQYLYTVFPDAEYGYSKEREKAYKKQKKNRT